MRFFVAEFTLRVNEGLLRMTEREGISMTKSERLRMRASGSELRMVDSSLPMVAQNDKRRRAFTDAWLY